MFDDNLFSSQTLADDYSIQSIEIPETGFYTFSISQKGDRMFPKNAGYEYSNTRMVLVKQVDDKL